jgi:hypothetical protein
MRIDWAIAAVTFLMFLSWAFSYYTYFQQAVSVPQGQAAMRAGDAVSSYMMMKTLSMPANITLGYSAPGSVVWAYVNWTGNFRNSTRVTLSRGSTDSLDCMISGSHLYWEADLSAGKNTFFIEQADMDAPVNCSASLPQPLGNETTAWATEPGHAFSRERNAAVCALMNSDYAAAKDAIGIGYDFRMEVSDGGAPYYCGLPNVPQGRDVFSFPYSGSLWEGGVVNITVVLWQ